METDRSGRYRRPAGRGSCSRTRPDSSVAARFAPTAPLGELSPSVDRSSRASRPPHPARGAARREAASFRPANVRRSYSRRPTGQWPLGRRGVDRARGPRSPSAVADSHEVPESPPWMLEDPQWTCLCPSHGRTNSGWRTDVSRAIRRTRRADRPWPPPLPTSRPNATPLSARPTRQRIKEGCSFAVS